MELSLKGISSIALILDPCNHDKIAGGEDVEVAGHANAGRFASSPDDYVRATFHAARVFNLTEALHFDSYSVVDQHSESFEVVTVGISQPLDAVRLPALNVQDAHVVHRAHEMVPRDAVERWLHSGYPGLEWVTHHSWADIDEYAGAASAGSLQQLGEVRFGDLAAGHEARVSTVPLAETSGISGTSAIADRRLSAPIVVRTGERAPSVTTGTVVAADGQWSARLNGDSMVLESPHEGRREFPNWLLSLGSNDDARVLALREYQRSFQVLVATSHGTFSATTSDGRGWQHKEVPFAGAAAHAVSGVLIGAEMVLVLEDGSIVFEGSDVPAGTDLGEVETAIGVDAARIGYCRLILIWGRTRAGAPCAVALRRPSRARRWDMVAEWPGVVRGGIERRDGRASHSETTIWLLRADSDALVKETVPLG